MKIKYWCNIILGVLLIGCGVTTRNYSNRPPFSNSVGKEVTLKRSQIIWEKFQKCEYGIISYTMESPENSYLSNSARRVITLPAGAKILVEKVVRQDVHSTLSSSAVYALCRTEMPDGSVIRFEYNWGLLGDIKMAPWEASGLGERHY